MTKVYIYIGIFLIISWVGMWFGIKSIYKSLDSGEDSKLAKMFLPKDYMRNLEMIERQAQRKKREEERKQKMQASEGSSPEEITAESGEDDEIKEV